MEAVFSTFGSSEEHVGLVAASLGAKEVVSLGEWGSCNCFSVLLMPVPHFGTKKPQLFKVDIAKAV